MYQRIKVLLLPLVMTLLVPFLWWRGLRLRYLPPIMVYMAAGIAGLTGIVGTFYVKERLGLSAEFLAAIGFWAGLPWALKMPLGHLVDLMWKWKSVLVYIGAALLALSVLIMIGLIGYPIRMAEYASVEAWFVLSTILGPVGYVMQDVVADAMTVEAVPRVDERGAPVSEADQKKQHTTVQALGRMAIISGSIYVALLNVFLMSGVGDLPMEGKTATYLLVYQLALIIPAVSVAGVLVAWLIKRRDITRLVQDGYTSQKARGILETQQAPPPINWWIIGGGLLFAILSLSVGLGNVPAGQEIIFVGSMAIILFMMVKLMPELDPKVRGTIVGIAIIVFAFRAVPGPGAGSSWWMMDELAFDQAFFAQLSLIGSFLALSGIVLFQTFMATRSIPYIFGFLTIALTVLALPIVGMYYGLHEWTSAMTGGLVGARTIALVDTALESPLGQVAMIPMLAWIAHSAPAHLKATFFAVFASFTNLALSASQLGTKYLNQIFTVTREVRDASDAVETQADYSELGWILISATTIGFVVPLLAILIFRHRANRKTTVHATL